MVASASERKVWPWNFASDSNCFQSVRVFRKWKSSHGESKSQRAIGHLIQKKEKQGAGWFSYHKLYKNEWVCQKFWGLINHLYQFTKPENCLNFTQPHMKCEIAKIHTHLFASQNALVLISNGKAEKKRRKWSNTFPGFQMDRVGSFQYNCQLH